MEQTKSQPKVSILIPVYNTACYLPKCLASAMNQTLKEIEIIAVNDASPDNAAEVLADYASRDPRIKVITHEKNGGILAARLSGIAAATGEYMMVLDADDYLDLDTARACYAKAKKTGADMIHFCFDVRIGHQKKNHFARNVEKRINPHNGKLLGKEVFEGAFVKYLYSWNICGKFIAADIWRKAAASLPPGYYIMAEDFCFYTMLSWYATHYEPLFKKCYYYGLDIGVSNYGLTDYQGFLRNCTVFTALNAVKSFLQAQGCFETYSKEFREQERRILDELLERWEKKLTRYDRVRTLSYMFENYDPQGLMRSFISYFAGRENVLGSLMGMPEYFRRRKKTAAEVRHIGLYLRDKNGEDAIARLLKRCAADWQKAGYKITAIAAAYSCDCLSLPAGMERIPMPGHPAGLDQETLQQRSAFWFGLREKYGIDTVVHGDSDGPNMIFDALSIKLAGMNLIGVPLTGMHALADSSMGDFLAKMRAMLLADGLAVLTDADKAFYSTFGERCCKISMAAAETPEKNPPGKSNETGKVHSISLSPPKPRLLWLGHFGDPEAETVLSAWAKLSREFPEYRLCMLGRSRNGVSDRCVLTLADSMNLAKTLEIYSDPDEFISLLPESKLFFMTSAANDCSIYAGMAKQAGKPVFLSRTPLPEILAEKLSGILKGLEKGSAVPEQQDCSGLELFRNMNSESAAPFAAEELLETLAGYQQKFEPYALLPANRGPSFIQLYRKLDELMYRFFPPASGRRDWFYRACRYVLNRLRKMKSS